MSSRLNYHAASPAGMKALGQVYAHVAQSGLDPTMIELVYLRVSQINGCAFCIGMHMSDLIKRGVPIEKLSLVPVWREAASLFTEKERAALGWAETVTNVATSGVPDAVYETAAAAFSKQELTDLTIAIGLMNTFNRLAISFRAIPAAVNELPKAN